MRKPCRSCGVENYHLSPDHEERHDYLCPECRRLYHREYYKKYANSHPERLEAKEVVKEFLKEGFLDRDDCSVCGSPFSQAHHPDDRFPLKVVWLCPQHHADAHKKKPIFSRG